MQSKLPEKSTRINFNLYQEHRNNIKNITQKVDNKAPFLNVGELYKPGILGKNAKRLLQMENENLTLIKTINIIYRKKGETDCSKPISMVQKKSNIVESTKAKNKIIFAENVRLFDKIYHAKPRIDFQEMEKEEKANKARLLLASKYPDYNKKTIYSGNENDLLISKSGLPKNIKIKKSKCYLDIDDLTADERMGRLTIEVYDDIVPKTASNFLKLCQNRDKPLGYKGSQFFHIVPGLFCLGGDVEYSVGLGGQSALDQRYFDDENYTLSHNATGKIFKVIKKIMDIFLDLRKAFDSVNLIILINKLEYVGFRGKTSSGALSMYNFKKNENASQFLITFKPLLTLDERYVVFGRVVKGLNVLKSIEDLGYPSGKPKHKIIINECGQLC